MATVKRPAQVTALQYDSLLVQTSKYIMQLRKLQHFHANVWSS